MGTQMCEGEGPDLLLYIIRHGETDGNLRGVLQGRTDAPLNEKGRALAEVTARALADIPFDLAISSPLSRARETAEILLRCNRNPAPELRFDERILEMNFGAWEGCGISPENFSVPTETFLRFYTDPLHCDRAPDGENFADVCRRTGEFYQELIRDPALQDKTVLISTHGVALRCMLQQVYAPGGDFWHGKTPDNCAVNIIRAENGVGTLVGDDLIFYDPALAVNPYKPVEKGERSV